jgi:hypothetical protein
MNVQIADGRINAPGDGDNVWLGSFSEVGVRNREVCFAPSNRHRQPGQTYRKGAQLQTFSHRQRNFADKPVFAPVKANFPLLLGNHLFDDAGTESRSRGFLRDWTTRLDPA